MEARFNCKFEQIVLDILVRQKRCSSAKQNESLYENPGGAGHFPCKDLMAAIIRSSRKSLPHFKTSHTPPKR